MNAATTIVCNECECEYTRKPSSPTTVAYCDLHNGEEDDDLGPCLCCEDENEQGGMSEVEREMGMAHGNRGLADYGGLDLDGPEGCIGQGCYGCDDCDY